MKGQEVENRMPWGVGETLGGPGQVDLFCTRPPRTSPISDVPLAQFNNLCLFNGHIRESIGYLGFMK